MLQVFKQSHSTDSHTQAVRLRCYYTAK